MARTISRKDGYENLTPDGRKIKSEDLKIGDWILDDEGKLVQIYQINTQRVSRPFIVHNIAVAGNHNYFANGILVHNADYPTLQAEIFEEVSEIKNAQDYKNVSEMGNKIDRLNDSLDDLIKFTKADEHLTLIQRADSINQVKQAQEELLSFKRDIMMNPSWIAPEETRRDLNIWLQDRFNNLINDRYSEWKLQADRYKMGMSDKKNLENILATEYAKERSKSNPLFWGAYPSAWLAGAVSEAAYHIGTNSTFSRIAAAGAGAAPPILSILTGIEIGGSFGGIYGASIGLIISSVGALTVGIPGVIQGAELNELKTFKTNINKILSGEVKSNINLPNYILDGSGSLPSPIVHDDLSEWFIDSLHRVANSPQMSFMEAHSNKKEGWAAYNAVLGPDAIWDMKKYLSPVKNPQGRLVYKVGENNLTFDAFGNILAGYVGSLAKIPEKVVLAGGGMLQIGVRADHEKHILNLEGIGEHKDFSDAPADQTLVRAGYELGQKCGRNCSIADLNEILYLKVGGL